VLFYSPLSHKIYTPLSFFFFFFTIEGQRRYTIIFFLSNSIKKHLCYRLMLQQNKKILMTPNMIIYPHFLLFRSKFKLNLTNKNIINQVIYWFYSKSKLNNTPMNHNFESSGFIFVILALKTM
jgi:hypothetical protein